MIREKAVILFDGVCNFCNAMVNFIIRQDKRNVFLFAPLQSNAGQKLLEQYNIDWRENDSFVVIDRGKAHIKGNAALKLYDRLPWYWKWTQIFWLVPKSIRNRVYNLIARNRYKWFGKRDQCMLPSPQLREKFLL